MNRAELEKKIHSISMDLINEKKIVCSVDVLMRLQYLSQKDYEDWRFGKIEYLEKVCQLSLVKLSTINSLIKVQGKKMNLKPSWTAYNKYGKGPKKRLRFSKSGDLNIEKNYATHYVSIYEINQKRNLTQTSLATNEPSAEQCGRFPEAGIHQTCKR